MADQNRWDEDESRHGRDQGRWDDNRDRRGSQAYGAERYGGREGRDHDHELDRGPGPGRGRSRWDEERSFGSQNQGGYGQGTYGQGTYGQGSYGQAGYGQGGCGMGGANRGGIGQGYGGESGGGMNPAGYRDSSYSQTGYGQSSYGQSSYGQGGQSGYGQSGYSPSRYGQSGQDPMNQGGFGFGEGGAWRQGYGGQAVESRMGGGRHEDHDEHRGGFMGMGEHKGRGPKGYTRSDERIRDDVNEKLEDDSWLDASEIEVQVKDGEVTLTGTIRRREDKRHAEDIAERVSGVKHVQNNLRVQTQTTGQGMTGSTGGSTSGVTMSGSTNGQTTTGRTNS